jgi:EmrB/QacA subfamily drug resistance transporter
MATDSNTSPLAPPLNGWRNPAGAGAGTTRAGTGTARAGTTHAGIRARVARRALAPAGYWAALPVVLAGTFMVVLDFFIVNVALPSMQHDLHAGSGAIEWVVAGYSLTAAVFLITSARLGDRIGRRRMFSLGLAVFTLSSAACGVAGTPAVLVLARLAQGIGAALLMPNVLAIIGVTFKGPDLARALGAYGLVMGLAAVSGQLIGGGLVQADVAGLGWRACFRINLPIGAVALALAPRAVPESKTDRANGLDPAGTLLLTIGLTAIVLPLLEGRQHGWPAWTWISLGVAPLILAAFALHQHRLAGRGGAPLVAPALLRQKRFLAGVITQLTFWCGQASFFLVLALYLQLGRGLSALDAGLVFTILAAAYVAVSTRAPALIERHGRRLLLVGAIVLAAGRASLLAAVADIGVGGSIVALIPGFVLIGAGMGLLIVPLTTTILSGVEPEHAGVASGVVSTMQNVGGALGVAITGAIFFGELGGGYAHALELSLAQLAALLLLVAALTRLLPRTQATT